MDVIQVDPDTRDMLKAAARSVSLWIGPEGSIHQIRFHLLNMSSSKFQAQTLCIVHTLYKVRSTISGTGV